MKFSLRATTATICVAVIVIVGVYLYWSSQKAGKIFAECHKLQQYTPETEAAYQQCMKSHGLDPKDWE